MRIATTALPHRTRPGGRPRPVVGGQLAPTTLHGPHAATDALLDAISRQDERIEALLAALRASEQALAEERRGSRMSAGSVTRLG
jgi:hypothetical protein